MDKPVSIYKKVASGSVAAASIAVTLTAGSADVDLSSATIPRNYKGHLLKIYDSSNRMIQGYVYTDGAGTVQNIVSAKGGTTRNWASQAAGFDDTTNCTYEILKVNNAVEVATGSIAANQALMDTTSTNAFVAPVGVDLSSYQDGRHMFRMQNTTGGYVAFGYISATAPAGETLGAEKATSWTNWTSYPFEVFSSTGGDNVSGQNTSSAGIASVPLFSASGGELFKLTADHVLTSGTMARLFSTQPAVGGGLPLVTYAENPSTGAIAVYATEVSGNRYLQIYSVSTSLNFAETNVSWKQVTDPASTGARIVSTQGGATRSLAYKHASFNPNTASTYQILFLGD